MRSSGVLAAATLLGRTLYLRCRERRVDFLDELDLSPLQESVQLLDVGFVEVKLGRGGRDLGVREHADLQPAGDQTLDLFKLLKIRN